MIEALTLIIGFGLGMAFKYWLNSMYFHQKYNGWNIYVWKGQNADKYVWVKSDKSDIALDLESNGKATVFVENVKQ